MNLKKVTGIVLAGGRSSRIGTDKAMLLYKGLPLIVYTIEALKPLCSKVVISAKSDKYGFTGLECWPDEIKVNSAMSGIYTCLKRSETDLNLVLSCDMPLISTGFLIDMVRFSNTSCTVIPVHDNNCYEPLCAVYSANQRSLLQQSIDREDFSLMNFIFSTDHQVFDSEKSINYRPGMFLNVNSAADFDLLINS